MPKPVNPVYGWKKGPVDERDHLYSASKPIFGLPSSVDLSQWMPPIWDQGELGSCTAHGIGRCYQYAEIKAGLPSLKPSRLFLYYNERRLEGTISQDSGAIIRDGIKCLNKYNYGICDESLWPYDIKKFTYTPPQSAYDAAKVNTIKDYATLDGLDISYLKRCLYHGYPFTFGFQVFQNFEDYQRGDVLEIPDNTDEVLGGHCVVAGKYDDNKICRDGKKGAFGCPNSWGPDWGEDGWFWMSYEYMMSNLVSDKWMMRLI